MADHERKEHYSQGLLFAGESEQDDEEQEESEEEMTLKYILPFTKAVNYVIANAPDNLNPIDIVTHTTPCRTERNNSHNMFLKYDGEWLFFYDKRDLKETISNAIESDFYRKRDTSLDSLKGLK